MLEILHSQDSYRSYNMDHKSAGYILNHTLRQIYIPLERYYVSEKAESLWNAISSKRMVDFHYNDKAINEFEDISLPMYVGASKMPKEHRIVRKGESFSCREVFHEDHIIPISRITEALLRMKTPNDNEVMKVIQSIEICRMLKSEDRLVWIRSSRPYDEDAVIGTIYRSLGIVLKKMT